MLHNVSLDNGTDLKLIFVFNRVDESWSRQFRSL